MCVPSPIWDGTEEARTQLSFACGGSHGGGRYGSTRNKSPPSLATLGLAPLPRDKTTFKTSANKGTEVTRMVMKV